ncbi:MAG: hypothetical protein JXR96_31130 [Deltaproteobacteria bacterium]|nr:hypothetical protein [Deltaproteobacteria bacterium]
MARLAILFGLGLALAACGPGEDPCIETMRAICTRACGCVPEGHDCFMFGDGYSWTATDVSMCMSDTCTPPPAEMDYDACLSALEQASCGELGPYPGLEVPSACDPLLASDY